jgi:hypothetical protein
MVSDENAPTLESLYDCLVAPNAVPRVFLTPPAQVAPTSLWGLFVYLQII